MPTLRVSRPSGEALHKSRLRLRWHYLFCAGCRHSRAPFLMDRPVRLEFHGQARLQWVGPPIWRLWCEPIEVQRLP